MYVQNIKWRLAEYNLNFKLKIVMFFGSRCSWTTHESAYLVSYRSSKGNVAILRAVGIPATHLPSSLFLNGSVHSLPIVLFYFS